MHRTLSNAPYANNAEHMLFTATWQARSYYSWMFCVQLCATALGVSCYQCRARRYSSCFNSAPYVPLDPSQLTWCESNFFHILPAWAYSLLCLFVLLLFFPEIGLLSLLATLKAVSSLRCIRAWLSPQSSSCQCENKAAAAAQATTPTSLKPTAYLQISLKLRLPLCLPLPLASSASPLLCLSFFLPRSPPLFVHHWLS